ncbi:hypothetical protein BCR41DRAFT_420942 [Lobosporangium transversale]|uniref:RNI-like protein n=1 Tax=Lobosporangium transversale TaxID=64571 RepID=A0A1Y2GRZ4_9FUNG|nr:hypothetical protein BCR41DRAFT_420942 [Lobosporangium transversale]ORZ20901.1 hypothetical protein BCR41DRAFT_420942 [Lobosporangium transversale]|eukprot:XP_021882810.1 hypothetical protein BCR41DRAFT_420942 [Lobosporangium transversale]
MAELQYQRFRKGNIVEEVCVKTASTKATNDCPPCFVLLQDIRDVFPDALRFKLNEHPIPFLSDADGNRIEPPRIAFYPDKILDIITEPPQCCNCGSSNTIVHLPTLGESKNLAFHDLLLSLSNFVQPSNNENFNSHFEETKKLLMEASNEGIKLQLESKKKDDRMLELQLEAKEKDDMMIEMQKKMLQLQFEAKEKDERMLEMQRQPLGRLAILQKKAGAILVQKFEPHEYPVPRLFIILPADRTKWDPMNVLRNKARLHFLCEHGDNTAKTDKNWHDQIHLARHEGYEIRNSTEFFQKYGKYIVILLQWLKLGIGAASGTSLPSVPKLLDAGIDYSIKYMEQLSKANPALSNINTIDDFEALEGADLRQLSKLLQTKDEDWQLGNLYRITTETGHVRWVCVDHYRSTYNEREQEAFENVVEVEMNRSKNTWHWDKDTWDWNKYESHLGKVTITLRSRNAAREFYNALTNAKHVYEMDIALFWYWTRTDLKALEKALKVSNVSVLRLNLEQPQESITMEILPILLPITIPYKMLVRIISLRRMKSICIVLSSDMIKLSNLPSKKLPHLHELSFEISPRKMGANAFRGLVNSLKTDVPLTSLDLGDNAIGYEGVLALSEALKTNKVLTSLDLLANSIGKEGALALSEALKTNTTLTDLKLFNNSIGKKGAQALSEALKTNKTLKNLELGGNSIGKEGALALSEALKTNKTLANLSLLANSIGNEGALALSEALKINKTLANLTLGCNSIGKEGALALSEALKTNKALTELLLFRNSIGNEGALALSEALKTNKTLTELDLCRNSIGQEGALALSEALKTNTTLTNLNLSENVIGDEVVLVLSEALKTNMTLTSLNLYYNFIENEGASALSEVLKTNMTLTNLHLGYNQIKNEGALAFSEMLKTNTTLKRLELRGNQIWDEGALALSEAHKANKALADLDLQYEF